MYRNKIRHHKFLFLICYLLIKPLIELFVILVLKASCTSSRAHAYASIQH